MEWFVQHGADAAQGLVLIGVLVAFGVAWSCLSKAIAWVQADVDIVSYGIAVAHAEIQALETRVKSLEAAAERIKKRSADKATVRVAKVA
jgi:hypothetical protein